MNDAKDTALRPGDIDPNEHDHETSAAPDLVRHYIERTRSTTAALRGIAAYLSENGDEEGARLLAGFAEKFAQHETSTK